MKGLEFSHQNRQGTRRENTMDTELEKKLLEQVMQSGNNQSAFNELMEFYIRENIPEKAVAYLVKQRTTNMEDIEEIAASALELGAYMERCDKYEHAIIFYSYGLSLKPKKIDILYLLNNNIGYSLNIFGRHDEAQAHCEVAIRKNPNRYNAYKNLGISLQGLGQNAEAAENFMQAVKTCPEDPRALIHLNDILAKHPEIASEIEGIKEFLFEYEPDRKDRKLH
jgi:tetratricopeptide (TPR) repeat protein